MEHAGTLMKRHCPKNGLVTYYIKHSKHIKYISRKNKERFKNFEFEVYHCSRMSGVKLSCTSLYFVFWI